MQISAFRGPQAFPTLRAIIGAALREIRYPQGEEPPCALLIKVEAKA